MHNGYEATFSSSNILCGHFEPFRRGAHLAEKNQQTRKAGSREVAFVSHTALVGNDGLSTTKASLVVTSYGSVQTRPEVGVCFDGTGASHLPSQVVWAHPQMEWYSSAQRRTEDYTIFVAPLVAAEETKELGDDEITPFEKAFIAKPVAVVPPQATNEFEDAACAERGSFTDYQGRKRIW